MNKLSVLIVVGLMLVVLRSTASATLVAHWSFDNDSGGVATDSSGYGNHGTIYGAVNTTGKFGSNALSFNGFSDYVDIGSRNLGTDFSVNMWINLYSAPVHNSTYLLGVDNISSGTSIGISSGQTVRFTDNIVSFVDSTGTVPIGNWHMVTAVYNGNQVSFYHNGNFTNTESISISSATKNYYIGKRFPNEDGFFDGAIDEVRIYDTALDSTVINELYLHNTPEPATVLLLGVGGLILRRKRRVK